MKGWFHHGVCIERKWSRRNGGRRPGPNKRAPWQSDAPKRPLVPYLMVVNLARTLAELAERGLRVVGASDDAECSLYEADLVGPLALVLGAEGRGMRQLTRRRCDLLVRIPMQGAVESLNVSVAAGVCLYEALRQRERQA